MGWISPVNLIITADRKRADSKSFSDWLHAYRSNPILMPRSGLKEDLTVKFKY